MILTGGPQVEQNFHEITVEQLCKVINLLHPCMDDYLYVYDFINDFYYISPHAKQRFCIPDNTFHDVVASHGLFVYPADLAALQEDLNALLEGRRQFHNLEYRWLDLDRQPVWINCRGYVVRDQEKALYMIGCINEIGAAQKADNVSGLLGSSSLQTYMDTVPVPFPDGYLLHLGLDDFKEINEKLGIEYGDTVLRQTAECISKCIFPSQKLYRTVADEFLILDFQGGSCKDAKALYRAIQREIIHFVEECRYEAVFTISGGILESSKIKDYSFYDVMKLSEFSLNEAKRQGKNRCYCFCQEDYEAFLKRKKLTQFLRQAVYQDCKGFEAYFQPLFHARTNTLYGAETLMRFHSPEGSMVSPVEFIPILEETGLIIPVGRWILEQALTACKCIMETIPDFRISINVSYVQVIKSDIINEIVSAANAHQVPPANVIVELTESGLLESNPHFTRLLAKLRENGIRLALDDFGTGYSNFHYLHDLRPDIIKIDRSFTAKALANEYEYNLLDLISKMVHTLNLNVCVEGIETSNERNQIQNLAPDYIQGFYFGKPCPYQQFTENYIK
ncbi:MAG: EAL domain-containing protein [Lachnospiraceae bacterium]|nr:EAL domain-containing protein [Lachnospiraceae bacterium]